jgi:ankyrin repeat protein
MATEVSQLMLAQYRGDDETVARLLAAGHELDVHEAAAVGDAARLRALLDDDAALVRAWSADGAQPLPFAAFFGRVEACRLLLDRGAEAKVHARGFNGVAPINAAAANNMKPNDVCTEIVRVLLDHGADASATQGGGATALHTAAFTRNAELAHLLVAAGADPDARTDDGGTPRAMAPELFAAD